jgi:hypothetical protein
VCGVAKAECIVILRLLTLSPTRLLPMLLLLRLSFPLLLLFLLRLLLMLLLPLLLLLSCDELRSGIGSSLPLPGNLQNATQHAYMQVVMPGWP